MELVYLRMNSAGWPVSVITCCYLMKKLLFWWPKTCKTRFSIWGDWGYALGTNAAFCSSINADQLEVFIFYWSGTRWINSGKPFAHAIRMWVWFTQFDTISLKFPLFLRWYYLHIGVKFHYTNTEWIRPPSNVVNFNSRKVLHNFWS